MISVEFPKVSWLPLIQRQLKTYSNSLDSHQKTMRNFLGGVAMFLSLSMNKFDQLVYPVGKQLFKVNKKVLIDIILGSLYLTMNRHLSKRTGICQSVITVDFE